MESLPLLILYEFRKCKFLVFFFWEFLFAIKIMFLKKESKNFYEIEIPEKKY